MLETDDSKRSRRREIVDSRGNPTVEVDVELEGGGYWPCLPFPAERVPENTKLGSCATVTRIAISEKASRRQLLQ